MADLINNSQLTLPPQNNLNIDPNNNEDTFGADYDPTMGDDGGLDIGGDEPGSQFVDGSGDDLSDGGQALTPQDLRAQIADLTKQLNSDKTLKPEEKADILHALKLMSQKINAATNLSPEQQDAKLAEIQANFVYLQTTMPGASGDNWGDNSDSQGGMVSRQAIQDLLGQLRSGERTLPDGGNMTQAQEISQLQQALKDLSAGDFQSASGIYNQVLGDVGGAKDATQLAVDMFGETPSSVAGDNVSFDCKKAEQTEINLKAPGIPGKPKTVTVDNAQSVTLTPKNPTDPVTISKDGNYYVVTMGDDTFKINSDSNLKIDSDNVTGDIDNTDGKVVTGASGNTTQSYVSASRLNDIASKIGLNGCTVPNADEVKAAQPILDDMAAAMKETDPKKRADAWTKVKDDLDLLQTNGMDPHNVNNVSQLIFDALYQGLGDQDMKDVLKQGLIPGDVATAISVGLTIQPDENTSRSEIDGYQTGGPGYTHQRSANYLTEQSGQGGS